MSADTLSRAIVITGTDTGIGKTVVAAGLAAALDAFYWKPVQAGTEDGTDSARVGVLSGLAPRRILDEAYTFALAASPHLAAEVEEATIDPAMLALPIVPGPLVIEGAGGVLVPLHRHPPRLFVDQFASWGVPVVLVARTMLGTINHSLLSIEALRMRGVAVAGVLFVGDAHPDNERIVADLGHVRLLGRVPALDPLTRATLADAIATHVDIAAIRAAMT